MPKVVCVGFGYVGKAMYGFFKDHYDVCFYDPFFSKKPAIYDGQQYFSVAQEEANSCDLGLVCVPTPMAHDGRCDLSIVRATLKWLDTPLIIIKSTVEPGSTDRFKKSFEKDQMIFAPEFCGESSYWSPYKFDKDPKETPFFIFGGDPKYTQQAIDYYMPVVGPTKIFRQTTSLDAELCKYFLNIYFATKIIFANEIERICDAAGANFAEVRSLWAEDPRVDKMHTAVFKNNKDRVFGQKCLPKDLSALIEYSKGIGYEPKFLEEIQSSNERIAQLRNNG
tara:strand:- start:506 stop:1345 length:840 start_codon:yes stop_codon:yes gene_type:complete